MLEGTQQGKLFKSQVSGSAWVCALVDSPLLLSARVIDFGHICWYSCLVQIDKSGGQGVSVCGVALVQRDASLPEKLGIAEAFDWGSPMHFALRGVR